MTTPQTTTKRIEWSYQTSDHANRFGFGKTGCWTVELIERGQLPRAVAGFATHAEANQAANAMPEQWNRLTR